MWTSLREILAACGNADLGAGRQSVISQLAFAPDFRSMIPPRPQQGDPETEGHRSDHPGRIVGMQGLAEIASGGRHPCKAAAVQAAPAAVVPRWPVNGRKLAVRRIAKCDLQSLQRPVEGGADGRVPCEEPDRPGTVAARCGKIRAEPVRRERDLQCVDRPVGRNSILDIWKRTGHLRPVSPGPASASGMRPGQGFSRT